MSEKKAWIALENGLVLEGRSVGADGEAGGDLVFNTAMTGYHEILTDPSYAGQVVIMTYPLIGNYGVAEEDAESGRAWAEAFVLREMSALASNRRSDVPLSASLSELVSDGSPPNPSWTCSAAPSSPPHTTRADRW